MKFSLKAIIEAVLPKKWADKVNQTIDTIKAEIKEQNTVAPAPTEKEKQQATARLQQTKKTNVQNWKLQERFNQPKLQTSKYVQRGFVQRQHGKDRRHG